MGDIIEQLYLAVVSIVSLGVFGGLAFYILHASHSRWREFEPFYAVMAPREPKLAGMLRIAPPGFRWGHLSGELKSERYPPVMLGVHPDGLRLTIVPPFKHGCRDLFLPFDKMTVEPAAWDLIDRAYGIRMEDVDGLEITMFSNIMQWAAENSGIVRMMVQRAEMVRGLERV